jgi:hypothetical protein
MHLDAIRIICCICLHQCSTSEFMQPLQYPFDLQFSTCQSSHRLAMQKVFTTTFTPRFSLCRHTAWCILAMITRCLPPLHSPISILYWSLFYGIVLLIILLSPLLMQLTMYNELHVLEVSNINNCFNRVARAPQLARRRVLILA